MTDKMSVKEAALLWDISERRIVCLCNQGRIEGAFKEGRSWIIPAGSEKPADNRIKSGAYIKRKNPELPLPVGVSDYRIISQKYYYVDKTMLIKDFLDERPVVSLFTRPRRFGKTLNMDMLRTFFEKTDEDTSVYFKDKLIWSRGEKYRKHQGKYPVIFLTFKDAKKATRDETSDHIIQVITAEYRRHKELENSGKIRDKDYYLKVIEGNIDKNLFESSLYMLSKMLHEHYGVPPVVIIDEYDTPVLQADVTGSRDEVIIFMRNLFSGVFKDNRHLSYGFIAGILPAAKEGVLGGLNNLASNSVLDDRYGGYFGFTSSEVKKMCRYYSAEDRYDGLCGWYGGYRFGNFEIFNPWSVINCFRNNCRPGTYWAATSGNEIIGEMLSGMDKDIIDKLNKLIRGGTVVSVIDTGAAYPPKKGNSSSLFGVLLAAGYLRAVKTGTEAGGDICEMSVPNREISFVYRREILQKLEYIIPRLKVDAVREALYLKDFGMLKSSVENLLFKSASRFFAVGENFYEAFLLGLCAAMEPYKSTVKMKSGNGCMDILLEPVEKELPGIVIGLKAEKNCPEEKLKESAANVLRRITDGKYVDGLKSAGIEKIIQYGVAFSGENAAVITKSGF